MKLTIVVPALNEEQAIGGTIERCIDARETIMRDSPVRAVEIIVVSDGSTDRTVEIAGSYADIRLIVFERNRGYGAAIKQGFESGSGGLVGFLDADGTCDPAFFATLCRAVVEEEAAVAIGSRMGPDSRMPRIRRVGNRAYALILSLLSNRVVTDTASGMRVIRRDVLSRLYPLPDGLHFTPAMSARVLMDDDLKIVERPMPYDERVGESKLHVVRDGVRFLRTILEMTVMWRPARVLHAGAAFCLTLMLLLASHPLESWLREGRFGEEMIYRLLFCALLGTVGVGLISAAMVAEHLHRLLDGTRRAPSFTSALMDRLYTLRGAMLVSAAAMPVLVWLIGPGLWTRVAHGYVGLHWSRFVLAGVIVFTIVELGITVLLVNLLRFHAARRSWAEVSRTVREARTTKSAIAHEKIPRETPAEWATMVR